MTAPPPSRPSWQKKRIWAAVAVWLVAWYPLSVGPACYCGARGWLSAEVIRTVYGPIPAALKDAPGLQERFFDYTDWWTTQATRHAASE